MISVIIPLFNAEKTIVAALESVKNQTYGAQNFEILVVNDGSTDESKILVEKFIDENPELNIHLLNQKNQGVSSARNAGLKICKGEFIALLDSDDVWLARKSETQLNIINNSKENIDFLASRRTKQKILFPYKVGENNLAEITFRKLFLRNEAQPSTVIFKRKILEKVGFFNENQQYAEDVNYWLKISELHTMYILNEELVIAGGGKRTFGISGLSGNLKEMHIGYLKNIDEMRSENRISFVQHALLYVFYKAKYVVILIRKYTSI